jgi:TRAP-type C4-dicarboxylate transport system substrate-binding protein
MNDYGNRITVVVFIAVLFWLAFCPRVSAQTRVRLATLAPRGTVYHQALQAMAEKWRSAPHGGVALTIYTDGTMGTEPDMIRRMRIGQIQAALVTAIGLNEIDHSVNALQSMPMMFRSEEEVMYAREQLRPELEKRFSDKGFIVLAWGDTGFVHFFSKRPALHPDDFKSMKMFSTASDNDQIEIMKSAGYRPVPLEWSDVLTGLQTGLVDAVPTAPMVALGGQYYTVARHMLAVNWVPLVGGLVITKKAWDALPDDAKDQLRQAAVTAALEIQKRSHEEEREAIAAMQKRGLEVHPVTPAVTEEWQKMAEDLYPKVRGSLVPAETFDKVQRMLSQYRSMQAKGGR